MSDYFTEGFIRETAPGRADNGKTDSWHGLGRRIEYDEGMTMDDIVRLAGWDWETQLAPCFCTVGGAITKTSRFEVIRSDNHTSLGNVGPGYTPLQPRQALEFVRPWIESGEAIPQTGGVLKDGAVTWLQMRLNCDPIEPVKGDVTEPLFLFTQGHGGNMSVNVGLTPVRVVCWNTVRAGLRDRSAQIVKVIHKSSVVRTTEAAIGSLDAARKEFTATGEKLTAMARIAVSRHDLDRYFRMVIDAPLTGTLERQKRTQMEGLLSYLETAPGGTVASGSLYSAFNAVTYWNSNTRGTRITKGRQDSPTQRAENRLLGLWFGQGMRSNERAWAIAENWLEKGYLAAA